MNPAWVAILLAGVGTFAMRASFLAVADRLSELPAPVLKVLRQIPPAALASLVLPAIVRPDGTGLDLTAPEVPAGLLAALVAWRTRNVALTLVVGLGVLLLFQALGWR